MAITVGQQKEAIKGTLTGPLKGGFGTERWPALGQQCQIRQAAYRSESASTWLSWPACGSEHHRSHQPDPARPRAA